jgi:hypothetical protein
VRAYTHTIQIEGKPKKTLTTGQAPTNKTEEPRRARNKYDLPENRT